ncbi:MAG: hypothetical protein ABR969_09290 [Sedimentisphaerales bacterium]|jgi:outer membrane murein-binding lipoprotein Lpp
MIGENKSTAGNKPAFAALALNFILLILLVDTPAYADENKRSSDDSQLSVRRKPIEKVQLISFNLTGGQRINGKLVSEDPYQIEINEVKGSRIVLAIYNKNDVDKNSVIYKTVSELDYWRDMGKYFLQKVWDFQDDPDEYMQAIRCYQKARTIAEDALGSDHKLVAELNEKIDQTEKDMNTWAEQAKSRSDLRKLEMLSTLDVRLQKIEGQINANADDIAAIRQELAAAGDYNELRNKITGNELAIKLLEQRLLKFETELDDIWQGYRYQPRYYIPRGRGEPNSGYRP